MPVVSRRFRAIRLLALAPSAAALLALGVSAPAGAAPKPLPPAPTLAAARSATDASAEKSALDRQLFFQLLVGEIELLAGQPGVAFEALLDGARKTGDEQLYRRATEVALQSRAGDQALVARACLACCGADIGRGAPLHGADTGCAQPIARSGRALALMARAVATAATRRH